jgi:non-ribosomal peptide synthetase component F
VPVAAGGHQFSVYHTGDVGQLSVDGCLTHLGRNDSRIKVRGFRVNIGEVEATITAHPEIRQATVVANEDGFGDARVVAYFVAKSDSPPATSTLRQFLAKTLPDYMIPSCFVALNELPLTAAGKVDRRALPDPGKSRPPLDIVFVAPRNEVEQRVAEIWERVLGIEAIGMNDNFFDLGGHSLSASRVITRVVQTFQLELSIKDLFASPNVAAMAKVIAKSQMMKADAKMLERMLSEVEAMNEDDVRTQLRGKESDNGE